MRIIHIVAPAIAVWAGADLAFAQGDTEIRRDLQYATHDGVALVGDYYVPKAPGKYPVVIGNPRRRPGRVAPKQISLLGNVS